MKDTSSEIKSRDGAAIITLVSAKIISVITIAFIFINHTIAAFALILYGMMIAITVFLCVKNMKRMNTQDITDKDVLIRLKREGVLDQYIRDINKQP